MRANAECGRTDETRTELIMSLRHPAFINTKECMQVYAYVEARYQEEPPCVQLLCDKTVEPQ